MDTSVVERLYPKPLQVADAAATVDVSSLLKNISLSTVRVTLGFVFAAIVALIAGFFIGRIALVRQMFEPLNDFLRYLPIAGFTSLTIFLVGTGTRSAVLVVFLGTVFHLTVAIADATRRVPLGFTDLGRTLGFKKAQLLRSIVLPYSAPAIFDSFRISVGWAWSYVTLAEVLGAEGGLGHAIEVSRRYVRIDLVIFWILVVGFLGLLSDQLLRFWKTRLFRWATD